MDTHITPTSAHLRIIDNRLTGGSIENLLVEDFVVRAPSDTTAPAATVMEMDVGQFEIERTRRPKHFPCGVSGVQVDVDSGRAPLEGDREDATESIDEALGPHVGPALKLPAG